MTPFGRRNACRSTARAAIWRHTLYVKIYSEASFEKKNIYFCKGKNWTYKKVCVSVVEIIQQYYVTI